MEKTGQKHTKSATTLLKDTIAQLDLARPNIDEIDTGIMDQILATCDFTHTKTTMQAMNLFYKQLWRHVVFPMQDELTSKDREIGRVLCEWIEEKKKRERFEEENNSLREKLQAITGKQA